jgi:thiamine-monophosphate kinase
LALAKLEVARGGIDISDGLAADLRRLGNASRVGAVLYANKVPVDPRVAAVARQEKVPPWTFSLASGGDFQFIVTVPRRARAAVETLGFTTIGTVTRARDFWLDNGGKERYRLTEEGHKDRKGQQFADEIQRIILETRRGRHQS